MVGEIPGKSGSPTKDVINATITDDGEENVEDKYEERVASYPRQNDGCIKPCPRFKCIMTASQCDSNCNRPQALINPCLLCEHRERCTDKLKSILLKPEVISHQKFTKKYSPSDYMFREDAVNRVMDLREKRAKYKKMVKKETQRLKTGLIPYRLNKIIKGKKLRKLKLRLKLIKSRIDEIKRNFKSSS